MVSFLTKAAYGQDVVTPYSSDMGATVGAVANRSESYDADGNKTEISDGTLSAEVQEKQQTS